MTTNTDHITAAVKPAVTTAEAAKILGVRADAVHVMKADGRLTPVGKNRLGSNLYAEADVRTLAVKRQAQQARRRAPRQQQLPEDTPPACAHCAPWRARALEAEEERDVARRALFGVLRVAGPDGR